LYENEKAAFVACNKEGYNTCLNLKEMIMIVWFTKRN